MHALSLWAKNHKWAARLTIILLIYPILNLCGLLTGDLLESLNRQLGVKWFYIFLILSVAIYFVFHFRTGYRQRRFLHMAMAGCTFCLLVFSGNHGSIIPGGIPQSHATTVETSVSSTNDVKPKKGLKKWVKSLRKKYREADEGTKTILIIVAILVAIALVALLGALACSIACSGSEALAYVVFLLGLGGIIFGLVRVIQSISRKYGKKKGADTRAPD